VLLSPATARAQSAPLAAPPPPEAAATLPSTPPPGAAVPPAAIVDKRLDEIEEQLRALRYSNAELQRQLDAARQQHDAAMTPPAPSPSTPPSWMQGQSLPASLATTVLGVQVKLTGSLTLRYAYSMNSNITDTLTAGWTMNGLRSRARLGVEFGDPKTSMLIGGIRLATGENPNPTVSVMPLGSMFQAGSFGLDQAWIAIRPFKNRERLSIILGRMPNPQWRGSVGTFRSEMIWDNDINPAGVAIKALVVDAGTHDLPIKVDNVLAYYQVQETLDNRFVGLTGVTYLLMDQLKVVATKYVTAAVTFYDWERLNNGLSSPGIDPTGVSTQAPTNATLIGPSFNPGNGQYAYGPQQAYGFYADSFRILNPTVELDLPIVYPKLGSPEIYLLADYAHNFSTVKGAADGVGVTVGARVGDYADDSRLNPLNAWFTYRYVDPDATISAFADSDLGAGTDYRGFGTGVNYRITRNLVPQVSYFNFWGFPLMENHVQTLYLDVMGDF